MVVTVTDSNFQEVVVNSKLPVMVDLWAEWCGPCRMIHPIIEAMAEEFEGKVLIAKLDVDSNNATSVKYRVRSIPTVLYFKNGKVVDKQVGVTSKRNFVEKLEKLF